MQKTARELIFISQIERDGSGTFTVPDSYLKAMLENKLMKDCLFSMQCLSITEGTYIASHFNSFVVKLRTGLIPPDDDTEVIVITNKRKYVGYYDTVLKGYFRQNKKGSFEPIKINNVISWITKTL